MNKISLSLLICLYSSLASAEQSIPEYLASTHITIMDFGLSKIADKFRFYTTINSKGYSVSPYWNDENNFVLRIISGNNYTANQKSASEDCKKAMSEVKNMLGINTITGKPKDGIASHFGAFFESYGSSYGESVEVYRKEIDKLVTIEGYMGSIDDGNFAKCKSKLVDNH